MTDNMSPRSIEKINTEAALTSATACSSMSESVSAGDNRPVGVFDSGFGGVSLLRNAIVELPNERFIYYGDNGNAPYGDRTEDEINRLASLAADFLLHKGVKALVVACNTATGAAIRVLRQKLDVPVVSVEPAIKPACEHSGSGKILMLATVATTRLSRYQSLQARMPDPSRVINVGCSGLVERIESGVTAEDAFDDILHARLAPYEGMLIDGIVLGCTHFVFISAAIARYAKAHFQGECTLYDGNAATARQLARVLEANGICADSDGVKRGDRITFFTSGDAVSSRAIFERLISTPI